MNQDELRAEILTEFKQVHKLAPADYTENCTNVVMSIIRTEKLKLLAEVRERVVGEKTSPNFDNEYGYCDSCEFQPTDGTKHCLCYYDEKLRKKQRTALTKLEAEL